MELSNGVDILKIQRLQNSLKSPRFLARVFGKEEIQLYQKTNRLFFLAGNFCAKEAFSKAIGTGLRNFSLSEVQALRDKLGKPYFLFTGNAKKIVDQMGLSFSLSISHEEEYAIAFVTAWKN